MFHGGSGNGERFLKISGWREQADATGLIAVFPTGLRYRITETGGLSTRWASFGILDEIEEAETPPADDVAFVDAMLLRPRRQAGRRRRPHLRLRVLQRRGHGRPAGGRPLADVRRGRVLRRWAAVGAVARRVASRPTRPWARSTTACSPSSIRRCPSCRSTRAGSSPTRCSAAYLDVALETLGLDRRPSAVVVRRDSTSFRWPPRRPLLRFTMIAGLGHKYPDTAAQEFWRFFTQHRLP